MEALPTSDATSAVAAATRQLDALERLVRASERRLDESGHAHRVGELAAMLARALRISDDMAELIRRAAPLHDVGLLGIPDAILLKPGPLTEKEYAQVRKHVEIGVEMLSHGESALLTVARRIVASHHERFDGNGYPRKLVGHAIPIEGQIVAIADFFDSLTRRRPHRDAWSVGDALDELSAQSGKAFNPTLVATFVDALTSADKRLRTPHAQAKAAGLVLRGRVDADTFLDLLLSLGNNARSTRLGVYAGFGEGFLVLQRGTLVHAMYAGKTGDDAVIALVAAIHRTPELDVEVEPLKGEFAETVVTPLQRLLFEAAVRFDHDEVAELDVQIEHAQYEATHEREVVAAPGSFEDAPEDEHALERLPDLTPALKALEAISI